MRLFAVPPTPVPKNPNSLFPQHFTPPVTSSAQVNSNPAPSALTFDSTTPDGCARSVLSPVPSCPALLRPQHTTPPLLAPTNAGMIAQVWYQPPAACLPTGATVIVVDVLVDVLVLVDVDVDVDVDVLVSCTTAVGTPQTDVDPAPRPNWL